MNEKQADVIVVIDEHTPVCRRSDGRGEQTTAGLEERDVALLTGGV
jgi:hypothetical protein